MRNLRLLVLGCLALALLAACGPAPQLRNERFLKDNSLIIANEECDAPCWRGITPGVTKWADALVIIQDATDLDDPQTQTIENGPSVGAQWNATNGDLCCQMASIDGDTVTTMFLQLAPDMTVRQLIQERGEPEYVLGTPGTEDQAIINLFYPEQSMIVFAFVAGATEGALSADSEIIGVFYTTPERMALTLDLSNLFAWKGYQPFSAYSPEGENPDYVRTQSVTLTPTGEAGAAPAAEEATPEATSGQ
jgi:hypothetical protein